MMPIKNRGRLCVQCCLSSFLYDQGINKTPLQMVCEFPSDCGVGSPGEGVVDESNLVVFCKKIHICLRRLPDDYKIQSSDSDGSLLIGLKWTENGKAIRHMVRFDRFADKLGEIVIMDPDDSWDHSVRPMSYLDGKTKIFYRMCLLATAKQNTPAATKS
jgi:hypothetical protein